MHQELTKAPQFSQAIESPILPAKGATEVLSFVKEKYPDIYSIIKIFCAVAGTPRPSGKEYFVRDLIIDTAQEKGWEFKSDGAGNISVYVPGHGRGRHSDPVCLQGHMDMVTLPETFDFMTTPLSLEICKILNDQNINDALTANGTTLGADNGIAVATALHIALNPPNNCPPLVLLFTAEEETGLNGASGLNPDLLFGSKKLLNLDSEEEGHVTISCTGGSGLNSTITIGREKLTGFTPFKLEISGLPGGHSGLEINEGRGNANVILAKSLARLQESSELYLAVFNGGEKRNAIPDWANATVWIADNSKIEFLNKAKLIIEEEIERGSNFCAKTITVSELSKENVILPFTKKFSQDFITTFSSQLDGVYKMSQEIEDLVETSSNFGVVRTDGDTLTVINTSRSSTPNGMDEVQTKIKNSFEAIGFNTEYQNQYMGWAPNLSSDLLQRSEKVFLNLFGKPVIKDAIHAGIECGVILSKFNPGEIDAISFGPQINRAHTPEENLVLKSVENFQRFLIGLLEDLCN